MSNKGIIGILVGAFSFAIILMVLVVVLGTTSDQVSKNIPQDSPWAKSLKQVNNSAGGAVEIIQSDPKDILLILAAFFSVLGFGTYLVIKNGKND